MATLLFFDDPFCFQDCQQRRGGSLDFLTVAETKQRVSSPEFTQWIAFNNIEPIGPVRFDIPIAILCDVIAHAHGDKQSRPQKWLPVFKGQETNKSLRAKMTAAFGPPKPIEK